TWCPRASICSTVAPPVSPVAPVTKNVRRLMRGYLLNTLDVAPQQDEADTPRRLTTRRGLASLQRGSGAHGRNGRGPAVDQEVCPDDVRRIVRREVNCQLRDFHRIGQPL